MPAFQEPQMYSGPPQWSTPGRRQIAGLARREATARALTPPPRRASVPSSRARTCGPANSRFPQRLMTRFRTAAGALLLLAAFLPAPVRAQVIEDARVLPRGWIELRGGGIYTQYNSRFGDGGEEPLGALFSTQLQTLADRLLQPIVPPLQTGLAGFFTGTASKVTNPVTPAAINGGTVQARLAGD